MVSLIEKSALAELVPLTVGTMTLSERVCGPITSIAPFNGAAAGVAQRLRKLGVDFPGVNQSVAKGDVACLWTGRGQAFLLGAASPDLAGLAATTDQSDGWAALTLSGPQGSDVLARLVALDLRVAAFPVGQVVRTALGHMMAILWRREADSFDIMVFRSMAATAVHEIAVAMASIAARQGR